MAKTVEDSGGTFVLLDAAGKLERGKRVYIGDVRHKDESWLRDTLFENPDIIPATEIDSSFGPLVPLCKELRTDAGSIDAVFINEHGRLTIIECKLWKNPQARREVVAQTLHYVAALAGWSYADLQRQVAAALGKKGNIPFELVQEHTGSRLREAEFVDSVSRSLREGRLLVLLAGDGIREGVQSLTELVNRSATMAFTFGLIEVALFQFPKNRFAIQPRVLVRTESITRQITIVNMQKGDSASVDDVAPAQGLANEKAPSADKEHLREWWQPVLKMTFDDPEQEAPFWVVTNNVVLNTPFPGIQLKAFAMVNGWRIGVFLSGSRRDKVMMIQKYLKRERTSLLSELPKGTGIKVGNCHIQIDNSDLESANDKRAWIISTLNTFTNVLRPRLRKWYEQSRG